MKLIIMQTKSSCVPYFQTRLFSNTSKIQTCWLTVAKPNFTHLQILVFLRFCKHVYVCAFFCIISTVSCFDIQYYTTVLSALWVPTFLWEEKKNIL